MNYFTCSNCGHITEGVPEYDWVWEKDILGCNACDEHCTGEWPPVETRDLWEFVRTRHRDTRVATVFACVLLEQLLEQLVVLVLVVRGHAPDDPVVEALLDSHQGRARLGSLFKRIVGATIESEIAETGAPLFAKTWTQMVTQRNRIMHGQNVDAASLPDAYEAAREGIAVFATLHNKFNAQSERYRRAVDWYQERQRWRQRH